jgi:hypothetical protein
MQYFNSISLNDFPLDHPVVTFHKYWGDFFKGSGPVAWSSFNPMKTPNVLPWIMLLDCLNDDIYRFRVFGTGCQQLFGSDQTGEIFGYNVDNIFVCQAKKKFGQLKTGASPMFHAGNLPFINQAHIQVLGATYGLSTNGESIDRIIAIAAPPKGRRLAF